MADVIVSKIQHRRGLRRDLPQPLDPGELGYCTDTGQLFIGAEPYNVDQYSLHSISILLFDNTANSENEANKYITTQLYQFDFNEEYPEYDDGFDDTFDKLKTAVDDDTFVDDQLAVAGRQLSNSNWVFTGYAIYKEGQLPISQKANDAGAVVVSTKIGGVFEDGILDLDPVSYVIEDSGAMATLMNYYYLLPDPNNPGEIYTRSGLVSVRQNIEVLTEYSETSGSADLIRVVNVIPAVSTGSVVLQYDTTESDSFVVDYSISGPDYSRVGIFTVTTHNTTAQLLDKYTEISTNNHTVDLTADDIVSELIAIKCTTSGFSAGDLTFTTQTRMWQSF